MNAVPADAGSEASDGKRNWVTSEEFLAQVEAHRVAALKKRQSPIRPSAPRVVARVYQLNPRLMYHPKPKATPNQEAGHE